MSCLHINMVSSREHDIGGIDCETFNINSMRFNNWCMTSWQLFVSTIDRTFEHHANLSSSVSSSNIPKGSKQIALISIGKCELAFVSQFSVIYEIIVREDLREMPLHEMRASVTSTSLDLAWSATILIILRHSQPDSTRGILSMFGCCKLVGASFEKSVHSQITDDAAPVSFSIKSFGSDSNSTSCIFAALTAASNSLIILIRMGIDKDGRPSARLWIHESSPTRLTRCNGATELPKCNMRMSTSRISPRSISSPPVSPRVMEVSKNVSRSSGA
mmetsp:Transcript_14489/g.26293  ORF Transcript_14489/g.26293 Transcript_14489/m.26293 type:complete len:274 (-) Transcript_14489:310-1131(-)